MMKLHKSWHAVLKSELEKPYIQELKAFLEEEKKNKQIVYPSEELIFNALLSTPYENVKVVLMGQDPYHGPNQAHGLCFSVDKSIPTPPSLKNIFKELKEDLGVEISSHGCLISWASQGVLMLNATLTVRKGEPKSHYGRGWEKLTDFIIEVLAKRQDPLVFMLWGKSAQEKCLHCLSSAHHHLILTAAHPSPYSAMNFHGCKHFSKANEFLVKSGKTPVDWKIENS